MGYDKVTGHKGEASSHAVVSFSDFIYKHIGLLIFRLFFGFFFLLNEMLLVCRLMLAFDYYEVSYQFLVLCLKAVRAYAFLIF